MQIEEIASKNKNSDFYFELVSLKHITFSEPVLFPSQKHNGFWFVLSGNGDFYPEDKPERSKKYKKLALISVGGEAFRFDPNGSPTSVLYVQYNLYAAVDVQTGLSDDEVPVINKKYRLLPHEFESDSKTAEAVIPEFRDYVQDIMRSVNENRLDGNRLKSALQSLIIESARRKLAQNIRVFDRVSGLALSSVNLNSLNPDEISFDISDIAVVGRGSQKTAGSEAVFRCESKYVERPDREEQYFCECRNGADGGFCHFEAYGANAFKVWYFRKQPGPISVLNMLDSGFLEFRLRCSKICELCIQLCHIPSYNAVTYYFRVDRPDTWTSYKIPLKKNNQIQKSPTTVRALKYIREHYCERITVADIAAYVLVNPNYLSGLFHRDVGQTIPAYINFCRINLAKQLLSDTDDSITNIASRVGYFDSAHFLKTFKKIVGVSPKEYRRSNGIK